MGERLAILSPILFGVFTRKNRGAHPEGFEPPTPGSEEQCNRAGQYFLVPARIVYSKSLRQKYDGAVRLARSGPLVSCPVVLRLWCQNGAKNPARALQQSDVLTLTLGCWCRGENSGSVGPAASCWPRRVSSPLPTRRTAPVEGALTPVAATPLVPDPSARRLPHRRPAPDQEARRRARGRPEGRCESRHLLRDYDRGRANPRAA